MDAARKKPLAIDTPVEIDFSTLTAERLANMEAAARDVVASYEALSLSQATLTGEILRGQGDFVQWDHYPAGDVYDRTSHSQYYYHAHPPDNRANVWGPEHGHFHTFLRAAGIPADIRPAELPADPDNDGADSALSHIVAISMNREGFPVRLFTTNRWVTGEQWYDAGDVIRMLDCFEVTSPVPSPAVNAWISAMPRLFRPQIEELLRRRDAALADWRERFPSTGVSAYDDHDLEVTSIADISVERQIDDLADELQRRHIASE